MCISSLFVVFKGNKNKKLRAMEGLEDYIGSIDNQIAVMTILGFLMSILMEILKEGKKLSQFV